MTADATVIIGAAADAPQTEPDTGPFPPTQQRTWTMPKTFVTRQHVDQLGRFTVKAGAGIAFVAADVARSGGRAVKQAWLAMGAVPPTLRLLAVLGLLTLLGIVGSIALSDTPKLFCAIVIVPVCSVAFGALARGWVGRNGDVGAPRTDARDVDAAAAEIARSIAYVDKKLTVALGAIGTDRHQQAVIALVQAKTATDLALGEDTAAPLTVDDFRRRPRIQAGPSLVAS
ncbi:hypothetical protein O6P37_02055 [Mycobacterium sp. CPCC 205372]|uniref:Uncharacterized protein n=1 Tax=Mycobacterium hippophais TaxID=3016340 RepID=A0ABT4PM41_9MYCO|nr:hypothetical protein [Mycobacterium hippophais]MCZ8377638.1 hypothetical protein [Mycobacterium hippophais]